MAQIMGMFTTRGAGFSLPASARIEASFDHCDLKTYESPWAWLDARREQMKAKKPGKPGKMPRKKGC